LQWQHNVNPSYKLVSIPRYDDIVRTAGWAGSARRWLAGDGGRSQNWAPYMGSGHGWLAGDWPSLGGVLNITAAAWTAVFLWWRSGNKQRTQNVSEYMLVLALCMLCISFQTDLCLCGTRICAFLVCSQCCFTVTEILLTAYQELVVIYGYDGR